LAPVRTHNHEEGIEMPIGTVKFFNEQKGFGFIQPEDGGADSFVHISDVERSGMSTLRENQRVSYDVEQDQRGKMKATNLRAVETQPSEGDVEQLSDEGL
jgi:CspA family cold shock protein